MAKPTTLPRWADVGGDIVIPPSGKLDVGWADNEQPANEFDNWFKNLVYQWTAYVNDGIFQHGEREITVPVTAINGIVNDIDFVGEVIEGNAGTSRLYLHVPIHVGDRIKKIRVLLVDNSVGGSITVNLYKKSLATGAVPGAAVLIGSAATNPIGGETANVRHFEITATETAVTNTLYYLDCTLSATAVQIHAITLVYDRVA